MMMGNKKAKIQAIMDLISSMDELESEKLNPLKEMGMEGDKKGLTIMKIEKEKSPMEMEVEIEPKEDDEMGMEDSGMEDEEENIDPNSSLARLKKKLAGK